VIPGDVDFRVMSTFIEFNIVLMQFVNFRLYHEIGIKQPHILDLRTRGNTACLDSIIYNIFRENRTVIETKTRFKFKNHSINGESNIPRELDQLRAYTNPLTRREEIEQIKQGHNHKYGGKNKKKTFSNNDYSINTKVQQSRPNTNIEQCDDLTASFEFDYSHCESTNCKSIFMGMVFYLSREVPYEQLSFIIKAFGGKTVLDHPSFPISIKPDSVTYYVVDRPLQNYKRDNMKLIQPQWIIDSINFNMLVPINLYAPGMVLPPHLCPFVNQEEEEFSRDCFESIKKSYAAAASKHYKSRNLDCLTSKENIDEKRRLSSLEMIYLSSTSINSGKSKFNLEKKLTKYYLQNKNAKINQLKFNERKEIEYINKAENLKTKAPMKKFSARILLKN
jgi:pescadillo protein